MARRCSSSHPARASPRAASTFELLAREAAERRLNIVAVSDEPGVRALAISAGLPAYDSIAAAEAALEAFREQDRQLGERLGQRRAAKAVARRGATSRRPRRGRLERLRAAPTDARCSPYTRAQRTAAVRPPGGRRRTCGTPPAPAAAPADRAAARAAPRRAARRRRRVRAHTSSCPRRRSRCGRPSTELRPAGLQRHRRPERGGRRRGRRRHRCRSSCQLPLHVERHASPATGLARSTRRGATARSASAARTPSTRWPSPADGRRDRRWDRVRDDAPDVTVPRADFATQHRPALVDVAHVRRSTGPRRQRRCRHDQQACPVPARPSCVSVRNPRPDRRRPARRADRGQPDPTTTLHSPR